MNKNKTVKKEDKTPLQKYREIAPTAAAKFEISGITLTDRWHTVKHAQHAARLKYETNCHFEHKLQAYLNRKDVKALTKKIKKATQEKHVLEQDESAKKSNLKAIQKEINRLKDELREIRKEYKLTPGDVQEFTQQQYKSYSGFQSIWSQIIARDVWEGIEKVLFGNGKHLNTRKPDNFTYCILGGREIERGNIPKVDNGEITLNYSGISGKIVVPEDDLYLQDALKGIVGYLENPETIQQLALDEFAKGVVVPTNRPKYFDIKVEDIRRRARIYAIASYEGNPPVRKSKDGSVRHAYGKGRVALDLNVASHAAYNGIELRMGKLIEDTSRGDGFVERGMAREAATQQIMSRCVRENSEIDADGNIVAGTFEPFKRYKETARKNKDEKRKNAVSKKCSARELANILREMGDVLIKEPNDPNLWKIQKKHGGLGAGKNVQRYCPGLVGECAEYRFGCSGEVHNLPKYDYRASQYDHRAGEYKKKELSERLHFLDDELPVSRDAYSVFLQYCCEDDYSAIDRFKAAMEFDDFYREHERVFCEETASGCFTPGSGFRELVWFRLMAASVL